MMLVLHHGGDRAMSWRGFGAIFEWTLFGSSAALPRMLGWGTEFVGPVAGQEADGCLNDARTGLKTSSQ